MDKIIKDYLDKLYNKFSKNIVSIYQTGSRVIPFLEESANDYDIFIIVDKAESIDTILKYTKSFIIRLENNILVNLIFVVESEFINYQKDYATIEVHDYQYYFMSQLEPLYGKKFLFKSKISSNKQFFIKSILDFIDNIILGYIEKYKIKHIYFTYKYLYHILISYYMLINRSYSKFTDEQIDLIKKAKNLELQVDFIEEYLTSKVLPKLNELLQKEMDR